MEKKWQIPAKTFLLGEYAALQNLGALILTTTPCFELTLTHHAELQGIHPDSPAGRWWRQANHQNHGLRWYDPFNQRGGMGASSAQFVGAYQAAAYLSGRTFSPPEMLEAYWQCAWAGVGLRPSGYDVMAQSLFGCVSIHRQNEQCDSVLWNFPDLGFILCHTGNKLATHHHLLEATLSTNMMHLDTLVSFAKQAFVETDSSMLIAAVNAYHQALLQMNLVDTNTLQLMAALNHHSEILAAKGCGAMGADVVLLLVKPCNIAMLQGELGKMNLHVVATNKMLYLG